VVGLGFCRDLASAAGTEGEDGKMKTKDEILAGYKRLTGEHMQAHYMRIRAASVPETEAETALHKALDAVESAVSDLFDAFIQSAPLEGPEQYQHPTYLPYRAVSDARDVVRSEWCKLFRARRDRAEQKLADEDYLAQFPDREKLRDDSIAAGVRK
jgi:hypothetical protein